MTKEDIEDAEKYDVMIANSNLINIDTITEKNTKILNL